MTQQFLGTYRAVSCRDGASLDRDGQPYVNINRPATRDGREEYEIQFADGMWMIARWEDLEGNVHLPECDQ